MQKYIVEARSAMFTSLYAVDHRCMAEVDRSAAMRFTEEQARECARREKRLRPGRQIFIIKVSR